MDRKIVGNNSKKLLWNNIENKNKNSSADEHSSPKRKRKKEKETIEKTTTMSQIEPYIVKPVFIDIFQKP